MIVSMPTNDDYRDGWDRVYGGQSGRQCQACGDPVSADGSTRCDTCEEQLDKADAKSD